MTFFQNKLLKKDLTFEHTNIYKVVSCISFPHLMSFFIYSARELVMSVALSPRISANLGQKAEKYLK